MITSYIYIKYFGDKKIFFIDKFLFESPYIHGFIKFKNPFSSYNFGISISFKFFYPKYVNLYNRLDSVYIRA